ncbi:MAG: hypothetical protein ABIH41_00770 [Nanoarchaeota archaeon]
MTTIQIKKLDPPHEGDIPSDIEWIGESFGLASPRSKEEIPLRIFQLVLGAQPQRHGVKSDYLARECRLTRAAIIYHLHHLMEAGLLVRQGSEYTLRYRSLKRTIEEVEHDVSRIFADMKRIAEQVDESMGLSYR